MQYLVIFNTNINTKKKHQGIIVEFKNNYVN